MTGQTKLQIINYLKNELDFSYKTDEPPEIGQRVGLIIEGQAVGFYVSRIDEERQAVRTYGGDITTVTTYTVRVKSWYNVA